MDIVKINNDNAGKVAELVAAFRIESKKFKGITKTSPYGVKHTIY